VPGRRPQQGFEVGLAAPLGHLKGSSLASAGGVLPEGGCRRREEGGAQQGGARPSHRLAFTVVWPGSLVRGAKPGIGLKPGAFAEAGRARTMAAISTGCALMSANPGRGRASCPAILATPGKQAATTPRPRSQSPARREGSRPERSYAVSRTRLRANCPQQAGWDTDRAGPRRHQRL